jgi:hypothetical protein
MSKWDRDPVSFFLSPLPEEASGPSSAREAMENQSFSAPLKKNKSRPAALIEATTSRAWVWARGPPTPSSGLAENPRKNQAVANNLQNLESPLKQIQVARRRRPVSRQGLNNRVQPSAPQYQCGQIPDVGGGASRVSG